MNQTSSPVADLSYRNYDGPLQRTDLAWWVIAKSTMMKAARMKSLWTVSVIAGWYFIVMIIILFFLQELSSLSGGQKAFHTFIDRIVWKDQFVHGMSYAQHLVLVVALMTGAGAIANDNRANALLVYLSKPCTKFDYVLGKWIGVFIPMLLIISLPVFVFYGYGLFSFRGEGFFSSDKWLVAKLLVVLPISAMLHTSLVLAFSSMFKQGRIAGAAYAGFYFMLFFFTTLMELVWRIGSKGHNHPPEIIKTLFYCSVDGVQVAWIRSILDFSKTGPFGVPSIQQMIANPPSPWLMLVVVLAVSALCILITWRRVRAVEVVG
ncbi:MAG TPA: ABC transporter permease subunit [Fimbriimonas sp.]|nr:ABC transporter permease subunit [Fimbriimonas sp.]